MRYHSRAVKDKAADQAGKSKSMLSSIMRPMITFAVVQIVVFVFILMASGGFSSVRSYAYSTVLEKTENRKNYMESLLNQKTPLVYEAAVEINGITNRILEETGLTAAAVRANKELDRRILSECAESLVSLLRRSQVNDAFLILDTGKLYDGEGRDLRPGLYLRDTDVSENSMSDNKDIFMEMGSSETARALGLPLDSGWSLYLDATDAQDGSRDFFFEPIRSYARGAETPLYSLGYWGRFSSLSPSQQGSIKYSLPLVAEDGTAYGVVGIGLLEKTVRESLPTSDFLDDSACFILAADLAGNGQYKPLFHSGSFYRRLGSEDIMSDTTRTVGYNLFEFKSHTGVECLSSVQELNLYSSGSPYRNQKWALISVVDKRESLNMYYALNRTVMVSIALTFLVCVLSAVITSRSLSLPVAALAGKLKKGQQDNTPVKFPPSGITEIDTLAHAITDLQEQIAKAKDDEYTAKLLEANAALRDSAAAAKRASSAKTDFLSRMSHDIRTPMNAIIGLTTIAEQNLENPEKLADCLGKISASSRYLLQLINEVLDMNKIESGKFVLAQDPINLVETMDSLVELVRPSVRNKQQSLDARVNPLAHENVLGDSLRIQQIFMNLVSNSVKYTPAGGHIRITVSERDVGQKLVGCYEFIVEDDGIGMSRDFQEKALIPFERAEDSRVSREQGTGLGLAIVDNIVKLMDGSIQVESEIGKGTKFTIVVYLRLPEGAAAAQGDAREEGAPAGLDSDDFTGMRALLVDDNELNREIAAELLGMAGLEVETAEDGKRALERFAASAPGYYDIIFMDVQMPVMNGYESTAAIRRLPREDAGDIPIVAMTANAFAEDVQDARSAGMDEHIAKPIDRDKLHRSLRRWYGKRAQKRQQEGS